MPWAAGGVQFQKHIPYQIWEVKIWIVIPNKYGYTESVCVVQCKVLSLWDKYRGGRYLILCWGKYSF